MYMYNVFEIFRSKNRACKSCHVPCENLLENSLPCIWWKKCRCLYIIRSTSMVIPISYLQRRSKSATVKEHVLSFVTDDMWICVFVFKWEIHVHGLQYRVGIKYNDANTKWKLELHVTNFASVFQEQTIWESKCTYNDTPKKLLGIVNR